MSTPLRLLIVTASEPDAQLFIQQLQRGGYAPAYERVEMLADLEDALARQAWDLVLSDWTLPGFSGLEALKQVRRTGQSPPFLLVGGAIGEEAVVSALQTGAQDYVKRENLARLAPAVARALRESALATDKQPIPAESAPAEDAPAESAPAKWSQGEAERRPDALRDAELRDADLRGTELRDTDLRDVELREVRTLYECLVEEALVGVYMLRDGPCLRFLYVNPRFAAIFGYTREELVNKPVLDVVAPGSGALVADHIRERLEGEATATHYQLQGVRKDGQLLDLEVLGVRTLYQGEPVILGTLVDITEQRCAEAARRESEERLRAIADHTPALISVKDLEGRFQLVNRQFEKLLHRSRAELQGKTDYEVFPPELADTYCRHDRQVLETGAPLEVEEAVSHTAVPHNAEPHNGVPHDGVPPGDERHTYLSVKFPLDDAGGARCGIGAISTDITARKRAEEQLRQSERRLAEAQQVARLGSWEWELATDRLTGSAELYRLFGVVPAAPGARFETFLLRVHPEDREAVRQRLAEAVEQPQGFSLEFRIVRPDGEVRVLRTQGEVYRDEKGNPVRMVGIAQDITERRQAEAELEAARQRVLAAEVEKKRFTRDVLRATTGDKLHLVEPDEVPQEGQIVAEFSLTEPESYARLRRRLKEVAEAAGMAPEHADNLLLATGEAVTNTLQHARGGRATVSLTPDRVLVRVTDTGPGICPESLPATVLQAGFSTKVSLGMGYTLMLQLSDCLWLATGRRGTVVQIANWIHPSQHAPDPLQAILDRF